MPFLEASIDAQPAFGNVTIENSENTEIELIHFMTMSCLFMIFFHVLKGEKIFLG